MSELNLAIGRRLFARLRPWALWAGAVLCAISLGWAAAPVIRHASDDGWQVGPATNALIGSDNPGSPVDLEPILTFAPFGESSLPVPEAQVKEDSPLGLTLLGVTIGDRASSSRAIISGGDIPVASYPAGAQVTADVRLVEIDADHVVLNLDGQRVTLPFPRRSQVAAEGGRDAVREPLPRTEPQDAAPVPSVGRLEETIARYRAAIDADANRFFDEFGLIRTEAGFKIGEQPAVELLDAGFLPGDVLLRINGRQIEEADAVLQQFDDVVGSGQVRVEMQRDGNIVAMSFLIR